MRSIAPRCAALPSRRPERRSGGPRSGARRPAPPTPRVDAGQERTLLFCKPYDVLCSFTDAGGAGDEPRATLKGTRSWRTLAWLLRTSPCARLTPRGRADFVAVPHVYAAGRLDRDSEGLLVLTSCGALQARLAEPKHKLPKTYWAQVEGRPSDAQLAALRAGVVLSDGPTLPLLHPDDLLLLPDGPPAPLWPRSPPIRVRAAVPTAWLQLTLREGRNRQVRRMTAAVGLPTLRLVRAAVGPWGLGGLQPGEWRELPREDWQSLLMS